MILEFGLQQFWELTLNRRTTSSHSTIATKICDLTRKPKFFSVGKRATMPQGQPRTSLKHPLQELELKDAAAPVTVVAREVNSPI